MKRNDFTDIAGAAISLAAAAFAFKAGWPILGLLLVCTIPFWLL